MAETTRTPSSVSQFPGVEGVKKLYEGQAARVEQAVEELGQAQTKWAEYGNAQLDNLFDLLKAQFNFFTGLATGWHQLSLDTVKKSVDFFSR